MKISLLIACVSACFMACIIPGIVRAQQIHQDQNSPCNLVKNLKFKNGITDTVTIYATYNGGLGKVAHDDMATLKSIRHIYGLNINRFQYAIDVTVDNCTQKFSLASRDRGMMGTLADKKGTSKLRLQCIVYRSFFADGGIYNFLYIDKIDLLDNNSNSLAVN